MILCVKIDASEALKFFELGRQSMFIEMAEFDELEELANINKIDLQDESDSNG